MSTRIGLLLAITVTLALVLYFARR